jgi:hypothetical protein
MATFLRRSTSPDWGQMNDIGRYFGSAAPFIKAQYSFAGRVPGSSHCPWLRECWVKASYETRVSDRIGPRPAMPNNLESDRFRLVIAYRKASATLSSAEASHLPVPTFGHLPLLSGCTPNAQSSSRREDRKEFASVRPS